MLKRIGARRAENPGELLEPSYRWMPPYRVTLGPVVANVCEQIGFVPDPEQRLLLNDIFAYKDRVNPAVFEYSFNGPRQQLKTGTLVMCSVGWLFVAPNVRRTMWTAHLKTTANNSFSVLADLIRSNSWFDDKLAKDRAKGIHVSKDEERIVTADGRELVVSARTESQGRGLTGDRIVFDEALYLTDAMVGAVVPTLSARDGTQMVSASSSGKPRSLVWRTKRDIGRAGGSETSGWAEWGTEFRPCANKACTHYPPAHPEHTPGCALDDIDLWWDASPLLGRRRNNGTGLTVERLQAMRNSMAPEEWAREYLGWWGDEETKDTVFPDGAWAKAVAHHEKDGASVVGLPVPADFQVSAIGVAVSGDQEHAAIAVAGKRGERIAVKIAADGPGVVWVPDQVKALREKYPYAVVVYDGGGPANTVAADIQQAIPVAWYRHSVTFPEWKAACAQFHNGILTGGVEHAGQGVLDEAAASASRRKVGDVWVWERFGSDSSPLEAATLAVFGSRVLKKESNYGSVVVVDGV